MKVGRPAIVLFAAVLLLLPGSQSAHVQGQLAPTVHPPLPASASDLWLVPAESDRAARALSTYDPLVEGVKRFQEGEDYAGALALVTRPTLRTTPLADYAAYYTGLSQLRLGRFAEGRAILDALVDRKPQGYLSIAAALGAGEAAEALGDNAAAVKIYDRLAGEKHAVTDEVLSRLGRAALAAGDRKAAAHAFVRVYYEFPLTEAATRAASQMASLHDQISRTGYKADIGRAQLLFGAGRYAEAREAFQTLQSRAGGPEGDDKEFVDLRVAESDFNLKQYAAARDGVLPYLERASRKAEAKFFYLASVRELGDPAQALDLTRALVAEFPGSSWSEEALNNLATHYIRTNEDELAARTFREMFEKFPTGTRAERAAWKAGWWGFKNGDYAETIRVFESAAANFPRSDFRPSYLYWAARSHAKLNGSTLADAPTQADARLRLLHTDYANSYYGRLAEGHLSRRAGGLSSPDSVRRASRADIVPASPALPTESLIRLLLASGLYDDALGELRHAQRAWGSTTRVDATIAWVYHQKGELRRAITLMRRAYPQFLTSDAQVPDEILQVIFPLTYWDSIRRHSRVYGLDPYVIAALIAQESTFDPKIKSVANAWGLMQVVPATGRRLARSLGIRNFTTESLTDAETNLKLGTFYFSRLVRQFGGTHYALASYNAGENRIVRWKAERPGLDEDEFIDDIPFPETQNYVKRILGTAEDYRRLYGGGLLTPGTVATALVGAPPAAPAKKITRPAPRKPSVGRPPVRRRPGA